MTPCWRSGARLRKRSGGHQERNPGCVKESTSRPSRSGPTWPVDSFSSGSADAVWRSEYMRAWFHERHSMHVLDFAGRCGPTIV